MARPGATLLAGLLMGAVAVSSPQVPADDRPPEPALTVTLVHPERQAEAVLKLFEGSPAAHPAAALASWKRATRDPNQLGKTAEAVIALFNPPMVREWAAFHEAQFGVSVDPADGSFHWRLIVPRDDGSLAALITALRLSGGRDEEPLLRGTVPAERLGDRSTAVAARLGRQTFLASSRADLERIVSAGSSPRLPRGGPEAAERAGSAAPRLKSGILFQVEPGRLAASSRASTEVRRALELIRGLHCESITGSLTLEDDQLSLTSTARRAPPASGKTAPGLACDAAWLSWVPAARTVALVALAIEGGNSFWDRTFEVADRVDRADPARAGLAPLRTRLNLMATAAGARLEADLWPHLQGLTLAILRDEAVSGRIGPFLLALHLDTPEAAARLVQDVLPRLAILWGSPAAKPRDRALDPATSRKLGRAGGRWIEAEVHGRTVLIGWGDKALEAARAAHARTEESAVRWIEGVRDRSGRKLPPRFGLYWPGRAWIPVRGLDGPTPLTRCLAEGPPIVWSGWSGGERAEDQVRWSPLHPLVRKFLMSIPLARTDTP